MEGVKGSVLKKGVHHARKERTLPDTCKRNTIRIKTERLFLHLKDSSFLQTPEGISDQVTDYISHTQTNKNI